MEPSPARAYRAACPNCGAPIEFRSAASAFAVCSFCNSTVVREGDALRRIGTSAELFDDHSPLQLGASGRHQGAAFTLVGRLQYRYAEGTWNEWHALFDGAGGADKSGWLSEDNGRYVIAFDQPLPGGVPAAAGLKVGAQAVVDGQAWTVASVSATKLIAVQGELPRPPVGDRGFVVADLRNARGEVGTLDYGDPALPRWSIGRSVAIDELSMVGLAEASTKVLGARGIECPNCGAALEIRLSTTRSIVCHQCRAVVDVSKGIGGELLHHAQPLGRAPRIPLGSTGMLALAGRAEMPWQVVGYAERCEIADDPDDEPGCWREYLLYHRTAGFAFLIDADDGWSWAVTLTGVPERDGDGVKHVGVRYRKLYEYTSRVVYVLGEFYWQVTRDQRTVHVDYRGTGAAAAKRLNREQTRSPQAEEVVWSGGETLSAAAVIKAFRLAPAQVAALQRDASPTSFNAASLLAKLFFWGFVGVVVLMLFRCGDGGGASSCDATRSTFGEASTEYQSCLNRNRSGGGLRSGGGSFGGYSSGGGHK
ncbi:MAG: DUF4178 domain-containing protein [Burkholderiaceae bacterium]